jgi:hypothetical protein
MINFFESEKEVWRKIYANKRDLIQKKENSLEGIVE